MEINQASAHTGFAHVNCLDLHCVMAAAYHTPPFPSGSFESTKQLRSRLPYRVADYILRTKEASLCCRFVKRFNKLLDHAFSSDKPLQVCTTQCCMHHQSYALTPSPTTLTSFLTQSCARRNTNMSVVCVQASQACVRDQPWICLAHRDLA